MTGPSTSTQGRRESAVLALVNTNSTLGTNAGADGILTYLAVEAAKQL